MDLLQVSFATRGYLGMSSLTRVRGMVTTHRQRSERARFPIRTFLAVLISEERRMVVRTRRLPRLPTVTRTEKH